VEERGERIHPGVTSENNRDLKFILKQIGLSVWGNKNSPQAQGRDIEMLQVARELMRKKTFIHTPVLTKSFEKEFEA